MKTEINNLTAVRIDSNELKSLCDELFKRGQGLPGEISIAIVDDKEMKRLNEKYYGSSGTTDVLSFRYEDGSGEIVLNPYQHKRQSDHYDNTVNQEFVENLVHGFLHLAGYDHKSEDDDGRHLNEQNQIMDDLSDKDFPVILGGTNI
ncbi:MAG: rRNA maturation RNase YbeY [bacterium]